MKIKINYLNETSNANKNEKTTWSSDPRRLNSVDEPESTLKTKQSESLEKDELKFADLLASSSTKAPKANQQDDESESDQSEDEKKERLREKEGSDSAQNDGKTEKYDFSGGGGQFGGQSGFGERGNVGQLNISEVFAARSILHVADLERLVSTIRSQTLIDGKREVILQLRRSVLDGLQVKITTDPAAKVQIEFLAANEKMRLEVEKNSAELAGLLRGRGINLETLKTTVRSGTEEHKGNSYSAGAITAPNAEKDNVEGTEELLDDNTFADSPESRNTNYQA